LILYFNRGSVAGSEVTGTWKWPLRFMQH